MKATTAPIHEEWAAFVDYGRNRVQVGSRYFYPECAEITANEFNRALAAHDAEVDKTRFVELTEQNKQLRLQLCRIMAAGPGDIEATIRILQKHRDIQNHLVEAPMLREQLKEAQQKYADLRTEIKRLL